MFGQSQRNANPNNDAEVTGPPSATVSSLSWSPVANHLIATSWDNSVSCWDINPNTGASNPIAQHTAHGAPVLCSAWHSDGTKVYTGGADKKAYIWDLNTKQTTQIAQHDEPIKEIAFIQSQGTPLVMTGSWDKTIKYWDTRAPTGSPILTVPLPDKIFSWDVKYPLCVIGLADRKIVAYNLENPSTPYLTMESPLSYQTRCVSCFNDKGGFAVGSIEGRVGIHYFTETAELKKFAFRCHRDATTKEIFPVNAIDFHPVYGTFSTAGSDGAFHFWDKESKSRLKQFSRCPDPITCTAFNAQGNLFAYATGYDWHQAKAGLEKHKQNHIFIHAVQEAEVKNKKKTR